MTTLPAAQKKRFPRAAAIEVAKEICGALRFVCLPARLMVCGSLRRHKEMVGDVEIVYVPKFADRPEGLFDTVAEDQSEAMLGKLRTTGVLAPRPNVNGHFTWGKQNKLAVHVASGIPVDLFSTTDQNWHMTVVIRTGPKEMNLRLIDAAKHHGLNLHAYGVYTRIETGELVIPQSEREVFERAGMQYLEPWQRR